MLGQITVIDGATLIHDYRGPAIAEAVMVIDGTRISAIGRLLRFMCQSTRNAIDARGAT